MRLKRIGTIAGAALACVAFAACGSDDNDTSTSSGSSGSATPAADTTSNASAPKGTPFVLGSICSCSGPYAGDLGGSDKVIQAWASAVNAAGGINGHPVKMIVKDDAANPTTSLKVLKELVEQDKVMAIVADESTADETWISYLDAKGIPVVGGNGTLGPFATSPNFFPSNSQLPGQTVGQALVAKGAGAKGFGAAYCAEAPVCAEYDKLAKAAATAAGLKYASVKIAATQPNYTAQCLHLKNNGVDAANVADPAEIVVKFFDSCAQQGYKPKIAQNVTSLTNIVLKNANMDKALMVGGAVNPFDTSTPAVKEMHEALEKYAPGLLPDDLHWLHITGWSGGKLFEAAAKAGKLTPSSTPADVKKAVYMLKDETLNGIAPPLTFTPGKQTLNRCYFTLTIENQKWVSQNGNKPTCLTAEQAKAVGA